MQMVYMHELVRTGVRTFLTVTSRPLEQTHPCTRAHTHTHEHTADTSVGGEVKIHGQRGCVCGETPMRARMGACGFLFTTAVSCPGELHTVFVCIYVCMCIYGGLRACVCCCCAMRRCACTLRGLGCRVLDLGFKRARLWYRVVDTLNASVSLFSLSLSVCIYSRNI